MELGRWLLQRPVPTKDKTPEEAIALPVSVPVYLTSITAEDTKKGVSFRPDVYGRDSSEDLATPLPSLSRAGIKEWVSQVDARCLGCRSWVRHQYRTTPSRTPSVPPGAATPPQNDRTTGR